MAHVKIRGNITVVSPETERVGESSRTIQKVQEGCDIEDRICSTILHEVAISVRLEDSRNYSHRRGRIVLMAHTN